MPLTSRHGWRYGRNSVVKPQFIPLRIKLALGGFLVQLCIALVLVGLNVRLADQKIQEDLMVRAKETSPLLTAALIEPLINRDYATLNQLLSETRKSGYFKYLVLLDHQSKPIAGAGRDLSLPLPALDIGFDNLPWDRADHCLHQTTEITHASQRYGTLRYATSLEPSFRSRQALIQNGILVSILCALLGTLFFSLIGVRLTRGLRQLSQASQQVMRGEYNLTLDERGNDEFKQLAIAFNGMSSAVRQRVEELLASHLKQEEYLQIAQSEHARLLALLHSMRFGVLMVDLNDSVVYANAAFTSIWQIPETGSCTGRQATSLIKSSPLYLASSNAQSAASLAQTSHTELHLAHGIILQETGQPVADAAGRALGYLWVFEDVTAERQAQQLISRLAERDSLTGLLNRHTFNAILESLYRSGASEPMVLLYLDLDNFKLVNDLNGHNIGDRLLVSVAGAISMTLRPDDRIARLGGDEFVALIRGILPEQLNSLCQRLMRNVGDASGKIMAGTANPVRMKCSIGAAWYPRDGASSSELVAAADRAMYAAKAAGRNTWRPYDPALQQSSEKAQWLIWAERVHEALENEEFELFLQGIYHSRTHQLDHYEALIRLADSTHPGQYFPPTEFITHAEDSGQIMALDRWVLLQCIQQLGQNPEHPPIAINVSARTIADPEFPLLVGNLLKQKSVAPERLHLEITETFAMHSLEQAEAAVSALQALGSKVGLDDFGSGFTSLAYLKRLRADYIKIDGYFMQGLATDNENRVLLRAIVDIAHATDRLVVAEWVEDQAMLTLCLEYNIDLLQGFLLDRPQPMPDVLPRKVVNDRR